MTNRLAMPVNPDPVEWCFIDWNAGKSVPTIRQLMKMFHQLAAEDVEWRGLDTAINLEWGEGQWFTLAQGDLVVITRQAFLHVFKPGKPPSCTMYVDEQKRSPIGDLF